MNDLKLIKEKLRQLEQQKDWHAVYSYLYYEWTLQKDRGPLCALLIEEMLAFLKKIDKGCSQELHEHSNNSSANLVAFTNCLQEALTYGLQHCLSDKYFLWRICYYLSIMPTYFWLLGDAIPTLEDAEILLNTLLKRAEMQYRESSIFQILRQSIRNDGSGEIVSMKQKAACVQEIQAFELQENWVDEAVKWANRE